MLFLRFSSSSISLKSNIFVHLFSESVFSIYIRNILVICVAHTSIAVDGHRGLKYGAFTYTNWI